jgi:hypothetical protein
MDVEFPDIQADFSAFICRENQLKVDCLILKIKTQESIEILETIYPKTQCCTL